MERGNSRTPSSSKCSNSDAKNKQDVTNKHLRLPRVKESVSPRPETRRKTNPQRNRELFDKRPRNRAGAGYERYRNEITETTVNDPEAKHGSKKMNLNHLLNFTLAPTESSEISGRRATYNRTKLPRYNKELFLQANCQFVARDNGNYTVHQKNPDILVEWSSIEEIRLPSLEVPLCPICLYRPIAAKITRCGHIYCWPCILHYLALTDQTWQKCPICFEAVHKTELKSVAMRALKNFVTGDEITLCLMKREKGTLLPSPVSYQNPLRLMCNVDDDDSITRFQKLLLADAKEVYAIISRERNELEKAYSIEKDTPEACFIESALKLLEERENNLNNQQAVIESNVVKHELHEETRDASIFASPPKHLASFSSDYEDENHLLETVNSSEKMDNLHHNSSTVKGAQEVSSELDKRGNSFFYQAEDGQHIYLHNINVQMLLKEFGCFELAPSVITAKIVEIERASMTEVLRKRLRYLQHLPLTCEFQVVELDFSNVISKSTFTQFGNEVNRRRHHRNRKARDERRRERYIEQEENKKLGIYPKATYNLQSVDQFPAYDPNDFVSSLLPEVNNSADWHVSQQEPVHLCDETCNSPSASVTTEIESNPLTSFAQMLKDGPKTFNELSKKVQKIELKSPQLQPVEDSDGDECIAAPEYRQSFSDAIQAALDAVTLQDASGKNQSTSKKKKKGKKQLLFTTSMCRNK